MKTAVRSLVSFVFLSFVRIAAANSGDVYNFYFQKAPGPTTVIQGGGEQKSFTPAIDPQQAAQPQQANMTPATAPMGTAQTAAVPQSMPQPAAEPVPASASTAAAVSATVGDFAKKDDNFRRFGLSAGLASVSDSVLGDFGGVNLGAELNFNRYVGLTSSILFAGPSKKADKDGKPQVEDRSKTMGGDIETYTQASLGLVVRPIEIKLFGHSFVDLALLGGVQNAYKAKELCKQSDWLGSVSGACATSSKNPGYDQRLVGYYGVGASWYLNPTIAINAQVKVAQLDQQKLGTGALNLVMRF